MKRKTLVLVLDVEVDDDLKMDLDGNGNDSLVGNAVDYYVSTLKLADAEHARHFSDATYRVKDGVLFTLEQFKSGSHEALHIFEAVVNDEALHHDKLLELSTNNKAKLVVNRVNHREFIYKGKRYYCGWSSYEDRDRGGVVGWLTYRVEREAP